MRTLLLASAALLAAVAVLPAVPASAESRGDHGFTIHRGLEGRHGDFDHRDGRRDRRRGGDQAVVLDFWNGGYDDRYNGRAFAPDSYNDWWHDRTERSYPRWMQNNRNCARMWWSGGGWTC
jgi:hypothetical protein